MRFMVWSIVCLDPGCRWILGEIKTYMDMRVKSRGDYTSVRRSVVYDDGCTVHSTDVLCIVTVIPGSTVSV